MQQDNLSKSLNEAQSVTEPPADWPELGTAGDTASPAIRRAIDRWLDLTQCWIEADRYDRPIVARQIDRAASVIAELMEATQSAAER